MANFAISNSVTTTQTLNFSENGFITQNGSVAVIGNDAIVTTNNNDLVINGTVASDLNAISSSGSSLELVVGALGNILSTGSYGVLSNTNNGVFINNIGSISSTANGVSLFLSDGSGTHKVNNSGTILGSSNGLIIEARGLGSYIVNSGTISGTDRYGVAGSQTTDAVLEVRNTGVISGRLASFFGNNDDGSGLSSDRVYNAGVMQGDVELRGGDDLYDGRGGTLTGSVLGGAGNDLYIIDQAGISLVELAEGGTDEVQSEVDFALGDNFETLTLIGAQDINATGNGTGNTITGNAGNNTLRGKAGGDSLSGGDGEDVIRGGKGTDTLSGGDGDDTLRGGRSNDTLNGGNDNDILLGGLGSDTLTGGTGADLFVFNRKNDSTNTGNDVITDFSLGEDLVDLSGLPGALTLIGSSGFSGTAGEVRVVTTGGSNNVIRVDLDGDGSGDMKILVQGVTGLGEDDFIL